MFKDSRIIEEIYNSMLDYSFKIVNIQNSPDNPYRGTIYYCHIYRLDSAWGTVIAYGQGGSKRKCKVLSNGQWSDWSD